MQKPMPNSLVIFSGGQDSTTCLFWARANTTGHVAAVTFAYGQRHKAEVDVARTIAAEQGVEHHVLDLSLLGQLAESALTRVDQPLTHGGAGVLPSSFVPLRNLFFLNFAASLGVKLGIYDIVTGVSQTDFSGYPDCRDVFIKATNVALNVALGDQQEQQFRIHTPLMWLTKAETWALADQLGQLEYVREQTLTCYEGVMGAGCGVCPACLLRKRGLEQYLTSK